MKTTFILIVMLCVVGCGGKRAEQQKERAEPAPKKPYNSRVKVIGDSRDNPTSAVQFVVEADLRPEEGR